MYVFINFVWTVKHRSLEQVIVLNLSRRGSGWYCMHIRMHRAKCPYCVFSTKAVVGLCNATQGKRLRIRHMLHSEWISSLFTLTSLPLLANIL